MTASIVITGAQGSGKTRLSQHLRHAYERRGKVVQIRDADDPEYRSRGAPTTDVTISTTAYGAGALHVRVRADTAIEAAEALHYIAGWEPTPEGMRIELAELAVEGVTP